MLLAQPKRIRITLAREGGHRRVMFRFTRGAKASGAGGGRHSLIIDVLMFVPGLALAGLVVVVQYYGVKQRTPIFSDQILVLLTIPSLAGFISALFRSRITSAIAFVSVALFWGALVEFAGISVQGFALFAWALLPLAVLFAVAIYTTVFLGVRVGPLWPLLAVIVGMLGGLGTLETKMHRWEREKRARTTTAADPYSIGPDIVTIDKCAHLFRLLHPELGYPESLPQLGPEGSGCLPEALLQSKQKGFVMSYLPHVNGNDGKVSGYTLKAEQISLPGDEFSIVSSDESGLIRRRIHGDSKGAALYGYVPVVDHLEYLMHCYKESDVHREMAADEVLRACWGNSRLGTTYMIRPGIFKSPCLEIRYRFDLGGSTVTRAFIATARPTSYGNFCGIRSYLIEANDSKVRMYATAEDRLAKTSDPLAKACEWSLYADCDSPAETTSSP